MKVGTTTATNTMTTSTLIQHAYARAMAKEATEVTQQPEGRWWSFNLDMNSFLIMEKKAMPTHLASLECLDVPTKVDGILKELEDAGEAAWLDPVLSLIVLWPCDVLNLVEQVLSPEALPYHVSGED